MDKARSEAKGTPPEVVAFYAYGPEMGRLEVGGGVLEFARTKEILSRRLRPGSRILDVGGGPGVYASWLAAAGHAVHLVDPVPLHVEQARKIGGGRFDVSLGDALAFSLPTLRSTPFSCWGRSTTYLSVQIASRPCGRRRVLRPGGLVAAAAISRFAGLVDGLRRGWIVDEQLVPVVEKELASGRHDSPDGSDLFTTAFFHLPEELEAEVGEAGFSEVSVLGVEGPGGVLPDLDKRWPDARFREAVLWAARKLEEERRIIAVSDHLMALGTRPRR